MLYINSNVVVIVNLFNIRIMINELQMVMYY